MFQVIYSQGLAKVSKILYITLLLLVSQLVWTTAAHAVCEELISQMFSRTFDLRAASKTCRKHIEKNVRAHASAAALIEVCRKRKNYSARYKNSVYKVARRCVEKRSANWLVQKYNRTRIEQLKLLKIKATITVDAFCKQKNVISYLKLTEKALSKTLADAKSKCY